VTFEVAAREHLSLRLSVAHSAIDHPPLGHLLLLTFEAKKKRTEEDSVSCPMKYSTDVECRSDSLAVISSRDINQFTYVN
jgi:hypothetical protein